MKCENCPQVIRPFQICPILKQPIKDNQTEIIGCNIDGRLPPNLHSSNKLETEK
jgi:hypothetical protein